MNRPELIVVVVGTATDIGKTWVSCRLLAALRAGGHTVAARKPVQSFDPAPAPDPADHGRVVAPTDAHRLALATGEHPEEVCPPDRSYPLAMAPPMAADRLGRPAIHLDDLVAELCWPSGIAVGLVETVGGSRSPIAHDGDGAALAHRLEADAVVLVADAGLGTVHAVRAAAVSLEPIPTVVLLNRFDPDDALHAANRAWLVEHDGATVVTDIAALAAYLVTAAPRAATP